MNEPQTPPPAPPVTPPPAQKKGLGPLAWVGIGCLVLLLLAALTTATCSYFVSKKVKEVAGDFEKNPIRASAEMVVRLNPELDLVEVDDEEGTMTIRNKRTDEVVTLDFGDIAEGRWGWSSDEGEVTFNVDTDEEGGIVTVTTDEGETTWGSGSSAHEPPKWVPRYPGAANESSAFTSESEGEIAGIWTMETADDVDSVSDFYKSRLEDDGFAVNVQTISGPQGSLAIITAKDDSKDRSVNLTISTDGEKTTAALQYTASQK
ncbi:MAG: hypothetical protein WBH85_18655 [Thermoanaerobaculia bacterium]